MVTKKLEWLFCTLRDGLIPTYLPTIDMAATHFSGLPEVNHGVKMQFEM